MQRRGRVVSVVEDAEADYTLSSAKRARVRAHLLDLIDGGRAGTSIPSERQLCELLAVSRPTLRSVVDEFVRDGVLVRHHGRGVFIARPKIAQHLDQRGAGGHLPAPVDGEWTSRTLGFDVVAAGPRIGRRLHVAPAEEIVRVRRLRSVDGEPVCVETIHLPRAFVPDLRREDLDGASLYALLRRRFDIAVDRAVQIIEPTVTDDEEAALLDVPAQSPALFFERTTQDVLGRPVEFTRSIYRGDRYRIVSSLELGADTRSGQQSVLLGRWSPASDPDLAVDQVPEPR